MEEFFFTTPAKPFMGKNCDLHRNCNVPFVTHREFLIPLLAASPPRRGIFPYQNCQMIALVHCSMSHVSQNMWHWTMSHVWANFLCFLGKNSVYIGKCYTVILLVKPHVPYWNVHSQKLLCKFSNPIKISSRKCVFCTVVKLLNLWWKFLLFIYSPLQKNMTFWDF